MTPPESSEEFVDSIEYMKKHSGKGGDMYFESIEDEISKKQAFILEQTTKSKDMHDNFNLLFEYRIVLKKAMKIIQGKDLKIDEDEDDSEKKESESVQPIRGSHISLGHIAGTINQTEKMRFKKLIFRATRGNALCYFSDIQQPVKDYYGLVIKKSVYVLVFQEGEVLRQKLIKICESFMGETFDIPENNVQAKFDDLNNRINETKHLIQRTNDEMKKYLISINQKEGIRISPIMFFKWYTQKEKYLYREMNKFKTGDLLLFGLFWAPKSHIGYVRTEIQKIREEGKINGPQISQRNFDKIMPPSYFKTNEFTESFQQIVNTYGVPQYKEANPTVFTIVTFPFLFGVMFGDIAHGGMLLLLGVLLCLFADKLKKTPLEQMAAARYLITLMGVFATFCGICYNDFASLPVELGSCYDLKKVHGQIEGVRKNSN